MGALEWVNPPPPETKMRRNSSKKKIGHFFCCCVILVVYLGHGIFFHPGSKQFYVSPDQLLREVFIPISFSPQIITPIMT